MQTSRAAQQRAMPSASTRLRRRSMASLGPFALLFVTLLVAYIYTPPRWQDWNQNSRIDLTMAIVDQGTIRIDDYVANTGDYALIDGHAYSDKAPGLSLAAVPVYAATRIAQPLGLRAASDRLSQSGAFDDTLTAGGEGLSRQRIDQIVALYAATIVCVAVPAALMGVLLARCVERIAGCRTAGILAALIIGLASPVFTYAQAFYGHVPAATCVVSAFACIVLRDGETLSNRRLAAIGALLGAGILIEYPTAVGAAPIALWALTLAGRRAVIWGVAGAVPPLAVLAIYDLIAFGTPLPVGYEHSALWQEQHDTGFLSLTYPHWDAIWGISFSPFRGLFLFAPVLLLSVGGLWLATRDRRQRLAVLIAVAAFVAMFLFVASSAMWWGGFAVGPRYLVPAIPLLAIPLGTLIGRVNASALRPRAAGMAAIALLTTISATLVMATTFSGQNYPSDAIRRPLTNYVWPAFREGDIARNVAMVFELSGVLSLMPLALALVAGVAMIGRAIVRREAVTA